MTAGLGDGTEIERVAYIPYPHLRHVYHDS